MKTFKFNYSSFGTLLKAMTALAIGSLSLTMPLPIFAQERGTRCEVREGGAGPDRPPVSERFRIVYGKVKPYGGGNASMTDVTIANPPRIFRRINMVAPYRLNYGGGFYTLIASNGNTISFSFGDSPGEFNVQRGGGTTFGKYYTRNYGNDGKLFDQEIDIICFFLND